PFGDSLYTEDDFAVVDVNAEVAAERGVTPAQTALAWLLSKPIVTAPIVGATKLNHLDDAIAATELTLDEKEIERLEAPYVPHAISGH
ncbi:MAG TPA: aldo/keto reductase, partial [Dactylosporangium sp.]|nr:aldo/keto reductase [Dactylosporangium sp.]